MSCDLEWQTVLYSTIGTAVSPTAVEVKPPHDNALPYVHIGEVLIEDNPIGHEIFADVHTWSSAEGTHELKTMQAAIRAALHNMTFTSTSFRFTACREEDCRVITDADGETFHGVQRFRALAATL